MLIGELVAIVVLAGVLCYVLHLHEQERQRWMRLLSVNLGHSSLSIADPVQRGEPTAPAPPRQVHKFSVPVPRGAVPRPIGGTSAEAIAQFNAAQRSAAPAAKQ